MADEHRPLKPDELNLLDRGYLAMTQAIESAGLAGSSSAIRLYNDFVARGRNTPVTERDFTPRELEGLRSLVRGKVHDTGKSEGTIDYPDYHRYGNDLTETNEPIPFGLFMSEKYKIHPWTIGGFRYQMNPKGDINIKDTYGFNVERGGGEAEVPGMGTVVSGGMLEGARVGRKVVPKEAGIGGFPVQINIPAEEPDPLGKLLRGEE